MAVVQFQEKSVDVSGEDTVLTAFEKANVRLPSGCRAGLCQACLMVVKAGTVPERAQLGLDSRQLKQNLFLACQCQPHDDLEIALPGQDFHNQGELLDKTLLNQHVLRVRFKTGMRWEAGQYTTVWRNETEGRSFSIASLPQSGILELHIRRRVDGRLSHWLETEVEPGDMVRISEAKGGCFYEGDDDRSTLLLAGTGTGLAPLYGVLQQALAKQHQGDIYLYAAAGEPEHLYLVDELQALAQQHANLHYIPVVRRGSERFAVALEGDLIEVVGSQHPAFSGYHAYLCGAPAVVNALKKLAFLRGASMRKIYIDAFESPAS